MSPLFLTVQFEFTSTIGPHAGRYVVEPALLHAAEAAEERMRAPARAGVGAGSGNGAGSEGQRSEVRQFVAGSGREAGSPDSLDPWLDRRNHLLAGTTRGVGASDVFVITVASAPPVRLRILRKARDVDPKREPDNVPLLFASFVRASQPIDQKREAKSALEEVKASDALQRKWVKTGLTVINAAIRGYRAGAPDPYAIEVLRRDARKIRIGYGDTDDVQHGLLKEAIELPPGQARRGSRIERLRPEESVANVLNRRGLVLEGEDLLLRALVDLDGYRTRAATFQVAAALRLIPEEMKVLPGGDSIDYRNLRAALERSEVLVRAVSERALDSAEVQELEQLIDEVAGAIDTWRYRLIEGAPGETPVRQA